MGSWLIVVLADTESAHHLSPTMAIQPSFQILIFALLFAASKLTENDPELARRIRDGDHAAFKEFFEVHYSEVERFLGRLGLSDADRQDVLQQAFLVVWKNRTGIDTSKSLRAFLFRSAKNLGLNHHRARVREVPIPDNFDVQVDSGEREAANPGSIRRAVELAVAKLPERRRAVFELCFLDGLTYREVADVLEISPKTVENQMGHALKSLRNSLRDIRDD